jgi:hypothetical protein
MVAIIWGCKQRLICVFLFFKKKEIKGSFYPAFNEKILDFIQ